MTIYIVLEINHVDFETGMDSNVSFCGTYIDKNKAMIKAKELMENARNDNLFIDNCIEDQENPFEKNNWVDFYHDEECQDYRVASILIEETKLIK